MSDFKQAVSSWQRAATRAQQAEERILAAYIDYVAGDGPLPHLAWETDAAVLRAEASRRLERIYIVAKTIRKPGREEFRRSVPDSVGPGEPE